MRHFSTVSLDIGRWNSRGRRAVYRALDGRTEIVSGKAYNYPGLVREGGQRLGQSVFALNPDRAGELIVILQKYSITYREWNALLPL